MKIVNRETFLAQPPNTLFAKYMPNSFGDLVIKGETYGDDFLYCSIADGLKFDSTEQFVDMLHQAEATGESMEMDFEDHTRDGLYDLGQLFAIYESDDVRMLIARLRDCI